jgi:outer membrane cobalamin receptor
LSRPRVAPGGLAPLLCVLVAATPARGDEGVGPPSDVVPSDAGLDAPAAAPPGRPAALRVPDDAPEVELYETVVRLRRREPGGPGGAATVVEADRFAGEARSVADLVATAPGVAVREYGGLGQLATASIRGSTADGVRVLLDGLSLHTAFGGGVDLSTIPRQWVGSIEIVRGPEGARFGAGALGGVLNVVTRPAHGERWSAQLSSGSFGTWSAGADGTLGGDGGGLLLSLGYDETVGHFPYLFDPLPSVAGNARQPLVREHNAARSGGALAKGFLTAGGGRLDALAHLSAGSRELPGLPHDTTAQDWQEDLRAGTALRFARPLGASAWWRAGASARHDRLDARLEALGGRTTHQRGDAGALRLGLAWQEGRHAVDAEISGGAEQMSAEGLGGTRARREVALAVSDELTFAGGRLRLAPALRVERVGPFSGWSATAGAAWRLAGPLSARATVGRTFRAPSFAELYLEQGLLGSNPALVPEEGVGGSAGLSAEGRRGTAQATAFASLYRDLIVYQAATYRRLEPANAGKARVAGIELEAAAAPLGRARVSGSLAYTLLLSESLAGEPEVVGRDLPRRPRHRLHARVGAAPGRLAVHGEARLVGRQYVDPRNLAPIPRALLFAAGTSLRVARRPEVRLHLDVRNLLDDRTVQDDFGNPLPSRMVLLGLRVGSPQEGRP